MTIDRNRCCDVRRRYEGADYLRERATRLAVHERKTTSERFRLVQCRTWSRRTSCAARNRKHFGCFKQAHGFDTTVRSARTRFRYHNLRSEKTGGRGVVARRRRCAGSRQSRRSSCTSPDANKRTDHIRYRECTCRHRTRRDRRKTTDSNGSSRAFMRKELAS